MEVHLHVVHIAKHSLQYVRSGVAVESNSVSGQAQVPYSSQNVIGKVQRAGDFDDCFRVRKKEGRPAENLFEAEVNACACAVEQRVPIEQHGARDDELRGCLWVRSGASVIARAKEQFVAEKLQLAVENRLPCN